MRKKTLRNFLSFLLVLVCTVTAVAALHLVTRAQAPSLPAVEEALPAAQLSASVPPAAGGLAVGLRGRFPGYAGHCGHWPGRLPQGEALREARPAGAAQLHPPGGHGVPRQKQSIRVFVLSYFTSEQGRQLLPALFLRRTKAAGKAPRRLVSCVLWAGKAAGQPLHILLDGQSAVHLHHGAA